MILEVPSSFFTVYLTNNSFVKKLISEYKPEETTSKIRTLKHSSKIKEDVERYLQLKSKYARLPKQTQLQMYQNQCSFLYENYTNIFNRIMKDELKLSSKQVTLFEIAKPYPG